MKKVRYSEEQIISIIKEAEAGILSNGTLSEVWGQRSDLLQLEGKIRRDDRKRCKEAEAAGR